MSKVAYELERSRATDPLFYEAPYPDNGLTPRNFQHAAVEYAVRRPNCIIGDAPGVGKTAESILISNAIEAKSNLVVCPASLRLNWEREIQTWSTIEGVTTWPILSAKDGVSMTANYVIISYNLLQNMDILRALESRRWDHMIFDEAHKVKDFKGNKTTRIVGGNLAPLAGRMTFATGTLMPNQPNECYNAVRLLGWDAIDRMSQEDFMNHYYAAGEGFVRMNVRNPVTGVVESKVVYSDKVRNQPINLDELQIRLRSRLMIRRLKEDILHELPEKQWHLLPVSVSSKMKKLLNHPGWKKVQQLHDMDPDIFDHGIPVDGSIATVRRLLGEMKAPEVVSYVEDMLQSGTDKIVIGAWHKSVLDHIKERLGKHGLAYMDGATSANNKQKAVDQFQNDPSIKIILGQKMPLGEGWTLTKAQDVVDAEPDWTPGRNEQLFDRVHRQGQIGDAVTCHIPVVPGTLDEKILSTVVAKSINIHEALDNG